MSGGTVYTYRSRLKELLTCHISDEGIESQEMEDVLTYYLHESECCMSSSELKKIYELLNACQRKALALFMTKSKSQSDRVEPYHCFITGGAGT